VREPAWWEFEHGPLVSIVTPVLAGRLVERLVLRRRPDWNRHEDAEVVHARRRPELGERARPYWAREQERAGASPDLEPPTGGASRED
jgi:hypothetical protein